MQVLGRYKSYIFSIFLLILSIAAAFLNLQVQSLKKEKVYYDSQIGRLKFLLVSLTRDINKISAYIENLKKFENLVDSSRNLFVEYNYAFNVYNQIITLFTSNKEKINLSPPKVSGYEFSFFLEFKDPNIFNNFLKRFLLNEKKAYIKCLDYKEGKGTFYAKLKIYFLLRDIKKERE